MVADTWYGPQIIRRMDFQVQLLKTFGYGCGLSLFYLHEPQLAGYLILKQGKEFVVYSTNGTGDLIQGRCFPAGNVYHVAFYRGINFAVPPFLGQESMESFLTGANHS